MRRPATLGRRVKEAATGAPGLVDPVVGLVDPAVLEGADAERGGGVATGGGGGERPAAATGGGGAVEEEGRGGVEEGGRPSGAAVFEEGERHQAATSSLRLPRCSTLIARCRRRRGGRARRRRGGKAAILGLRL
ncbi:hypothetical protein OsJ_03941 [Oryza sativa Japonica Group]|uniref:Uncharacterized protein n=1 Tax=Oryza sativa subsp. japonica TaxID=39947 RepID=B9EU94_ORYSJ|nr:hypothetical protein OsJ_03941 [Oryza sativa Japonica Group]